MVSSTAVLQMNITNLLKHNVPITDNQLQKIIRYQEKTAQVMKQVSDMLTGSSDNVEVKTGAAATATAAAVSDENDSDSDCDCLGVFGKDNVTLPDNIANEVFPVKQEPIATAESIEPAIECNYKDDGYSIVPFEVIEKFKKQYKLENQKQKQKQNKLSTSENGAEKNVETMLLSDSEEEKEEVEQQDSLLTSLNEFIDNIFNQNPKLACTNHSKVLNNLLSQFVVTDDNENSPQVPDPDQVPQSPETSVENVPATISSPSLTASHSHSHSPSSSQLPVDIVNDDVREEQICDELLPFLTVLPKKIRSTSTHSQNGENGIAPQFIITIDPSLFPVPNSTTSMPSLDEDTNNVSDNNINLENIDIYKTYLKKTSDKDLSPAHVSPPPEPLTITPEQVEAYRAPNEENSVKDPRDKNKIFNQPRPIIDLRRVQFSFPKNKKEREIDAILNKYSITDVFKRFEYLRKQNKKNHLLKKKELQAMSRNRDPRKKKLPVSPNDNFNSHHKRKLEGDDNNRPKKMLAVEPSDNNAVIKKVETVNDDLSNRPDGTEPLDSVGANSKIQIVDLTIDDDVIDSSDSNSTVEIPVKEEEEESSKSKQFETDKNSSQDSNNDNEQFAKNIKILDDKTTDIIDLTISNDNTSKSILKNCNKDNIEKDTLNQMNSNVSGQLNTAENIQLTLSPKSIKGGKISDVVLLKMSLEMVVEPDNLNTIAMGVAEKLSERRYGGNLSNVTYRNSNTQQSHRHSRIRRQKSSSLNDGYPRQRSRDYFDYAKFNKVSQLKCVRQSSASYWRRSPTLRVSKSVPNNNSRRVNNNRQFAEPKDLFQKLADNAI